MRIFIDGQEYYVNVGKLSEHIASLYVEASKKVDSIDVGEGRRIDFSKKSVIRTAMKAALVPFVVPVIGLLFRISGLEKPSKEKHEDLIDWMVLRMFQYVYLVEGRIQLNAITKEVDNGDNGMCRFVESISTAGTSIFPDRSIEQPKEEVSPGTKLIKWPKRQ